MLAEYGICVMVMNPERCTILRRSLSQKTDA